MTRKPGIINESTETKSEATFEAHLGAVLKTLFPAGGVTVTHQVLFTLRLGHHGKEIEGRKGWSKGRLDILLSSAAGPAAVLELKREDLDLTHDDRDQGLSYARLLQPMPPLVILSNGRSTKFYTTADGNEWTPHGLQRRGVRNVDLFGCVTCGGTPSIGSHARCA